MRTYILTSREEKEIKNYLAGNISRSNLILLTTRRAKANIEVLEEQLSLIKVLLEKDS